MSLNSKIDASGTTFQAWNVGDHVSIQQTDTDFEILFDSNSIIRIGPSTATINGLTLAIVSIVQAIISSPPNTPADQAAWIVGPNPTGSWVGQTNSIAVYSASSGGWRFLTPTVGLSVYVVAQFSYYYFNGNGWVSLSNSSLSSGDSAILVTDPGQGKIQGIIDSKQIFTVSSEYNISSYSPSNTVATNNALMITNPLGAVRIEGAYGSTYAPVPGQGGEISLTGGKAQTFSGLAGGAISMLGGTGDGLGNGGGISIFTGSGRSPGSIVLGIGGTSGTTIMTVDGSGNTVFGGTTFRVNSPVTMTSGLTVSASGASITGNSSVSGTFTSSGALTVSSGGATITGNSSITGTATISAGLTVSAGGATITGNSSITGSATVSNGLIVSASGATITGNSSVTGTLTASSTVTGLTFVPTGSAAPSNGLFLPAANSLGWSVSSSEKMRLTTTGLGIGTTGPSYLLDLYGSTTTQSGARIYNQGTGTGTQASLFFGNNTSATGAYVGLNSSTNTGTGVGNGMVIHNGVGQLVLDPVGAFALNTNGSTWMTVDTSGNTVFSGAANFTGTLKYGSIEVATQTYVQNALQGIGNKETADAAATGNVNRSNPGTSIFDGITLTSGKFLFLLNQTNQAENGLYTFNGPSSALTRAPNMVSWAQISGASVWVTAGSYYAGTAWISTSSATGTVDTTPVTFLQWGGSGLYTPGTGISLNSNVVSIINTTVTSGSYGSATQVGTFTVNPQGQLTAAGNVTVTPAFSSITSKPTTLAGYGITDAMPLAPVNITATGTIQGASLVITTGGINVTGNSTINGTLGGLTGLTVASGGASITGNSSVTGTLNVSSTATVGSLSSTNSASASAFIPTGSTVPANGLFLPAANTIGWSVNSTEKMRLDSSGRLGIGVTPTTYLLDVNGTSRFSGAMTVTTGGIAVTGASTISGSLGGIAGLTVASGGASITGNSTITGTLGVSGTTTVAAGTTAVAPILFQAGSLLTTQTFGAMEFDGTNLYVTSNSSSPTRNTLAYTSGNIATATKLQTARTISATGDASWSVTFDGSANTPSAITLATVNSNIGTFGGASSIPILTVNGKGLVTAASSATVSVNNSNWSGTVLSVTNGGTGSNLSSTGGASRVLMQTSAGAAVTVAQLAASDLSNGITGTGAVVLANSPNISGSISLVTAGAGIEIGNTGTAGTPYIDFHSSGNSNDYDTRLIASGGDGTGDGHGTLTFQGATFAVSGALTAGAQSTFSNGIVVNGQTSSFTGGISIGALNNGSTYSGLLSSNVGAGFILITAQSGGGQADTILTAPASQVVRIRPSNNDSSHELVVSTTGMTWGGFTVWNSNNLTNLNQLTNGPGYITNVVSSLGYTPVNKAGDTMSGNLTVPTLTASTSVVVPSSGGSAVFSVGTGDGASYSTYDTKFQIWWGLGMATYDGTINGYYNSRSGAWDVKGGFYVNGTDVRQLTKGIGTSDPGVGTGGIWVDSANGMRVARNSTSYLIWDQGNLTNLNQLSNGPGYITNVVSSLGYTPANRGGDTFTGTVLISSGNSTASADFLQLRPTDTGSGKPYIFFNKTSTANTWNIGVYDGSGFNGVIDILATTLQWNGTTVWTNGNLTNLSQLSNGPGYITSAVSSLGYTPVQQGGGSGQGNNKVYIGWAGSKTKIQIDTVDMGNIAMEGWASSTFFPLSGGTVSGSMTLTGNIQINSNGIYDGNGALRFLMQNSDCTVYRSSQVGNGSGNTYLHNFQDSAGTTKAIVYWDGSVYATGNVIAYWSDERLKTDIRRIEDSREILSKFSGYRFKWNEIGQKRTLKPADHVEIGFLAQEVENAIPQAAIDQESGDLAPDGTKYKTVLEKAIIPVLVEATKENYSELDNLRSMLERALSRIDELERRLA